jgi:hypothetical protein
MNIPGSDPINIKSACRPANVLSLVLLFVLSTWFVPIGMEVTMAQSTNKSDARIQTLLDEFTSTQGESELERYERGVRQAARFWQEEDGSPDQFAEFCKENFIVDSQLRQQTADRFEAALASIYGHFRELGRDLSWNLAVETGPILPIDYALAKYSPSAHFSEDMFRTSIAFIVLLNFPLYTLEERLELGPSWTREQWAQARLAESFSSRVPPEVSQKIIEAYIAADSYIADYNIYMHHLLTPDGNRPFPEGMKLITHWNLRDELKALYSEPDGLPRQDMIYEVMKRIIHQDIPAAVINNPGVDWKLSTNDVAITPIVDGDIPAGRDYDGNPGDAVSNEPEPDARYEHLLNGFLAQRDADKYFPDMPTHIDRRFQRDREMPEKKVEQILTSILASETIAEIGLLIEKRLGRELRPFDIWYDGFKARGSISEDELDRVVREKYPTVEAFQADLPNILKKLSFDDPTAGFLVSKIEVDPSRGAGHAAGPGRRTDKARLRTRVLADGMDYKGYNIAIHEFGHNVEQVFSLNRIDHTLLRGVPSTAFSEAFAFVFQARDLQLLGLVNDNPDSEHLAVLDEIWGTYEIGGVALVDMRVWNWMYDNPDADASELKDAVIAIAKDTWNEFFAPVFGIRDIELLAIYSHMIDGALYLPSYPIGSIIQFQIEEYIKTRNLAEEMERMCRLGSITPDLWMKEAVGNPISSEPMLQAAQRALDALTE